MALDTTHKLVSAIQKSLPIPDAAVTDSRDLQQILWNYSGILAALPYPIPLLIHGVHSTLTHATACAQRLTRSEGQQDLLVRAGAGTQDLLR